jgi:hypothetical protein
MESTDSDKISLSKASFGLRLSKASFGLLFSPGKASSSAFHYSPAPLKGDLA